MSAQILSWLIPAIFGFVLALLKLWADREARLNERADKREDRDHDESEEDLIQNAIAIWYDFLHVTCADAREKCSDLPLPCGSVLASTSAAPSRAQIEAKIKARSK